jgi:hypothetical protein
LEEANSLGVPQLGVWEGTREYLTN